MLRFEQTIDCPPALFATFGLPASKVLFFDIETTGFSPESSYVYLIGCAFCHDGAVKLRQYFLDDLSGEKGLIREFGEFSRGFSLLVHYNGATFDLPYLQKKAHRHRLPGQYFCAEGEESLDLYKLLLPYKKILGLKDLKQKTVEEFLGIRREDAFCGGDLIPVYTEFVGRYRYECLTGGDPLTGADADQRAEGLVPPVRADADRRAEGFVPPAGADALDTAPAPETPDFFGTGLTNMPKSPANALLFVLLLHNREDLTGLLSISRLCSLPKFLNGGFTVSRIAGDHAVELGFPQKTHHILRLTAEPGQDLPTFCFPSETARQLPAVAEGLPAASVILRAVPEENAILLFVPVFCGTLKYFFEDYKNYYYLPMEDCAMHKSIAQFVDKEYRKKATKETCYQKKKGHFLPQPDEIITPSFRIRAKDSFSYFEDIPDTCADPAILKKWAKSLLLYVLTPSI